MSTITERLQWIVDADVSKGVQGFGQAASAADKAEASTGKLHTGFSNLKSAAGDAAGAMLSPAGLAAGAVAVGAAAFKAVGTFEELGLKIGKLSDATGLTTDAASRWVEVADDAGVSTASLETAIGKMEKTAGSTPKVFNDLGVAIAYAKDGSVDANQTFLNAIDVINGIKNPNERAAAATQLFGKSWKDMAELIGRGSGQLKSDLESVQASKIYTPADVASARNVRDSFDTIHDAIDGLALSLGKSLAPALASLATTLGPIIELVGTGLGGALEMGTQSIDDWSNALQGAADASGVSFLKINTDINDFSVGIQRSAHGTAALDEVVPRLKAVEESAKAQAEAADEAAASVTAFGEAAQTAIQSQIDYADSLKATQEALEADKKAQEDLIDSMRVAADAGYAVTQATNDYHDSVDELAKKVKDAKGDQDKIKEAYDDTTASAEGLADATVAQYAAQVTANGGTLTATQRIDIWNSSMLGAAATASGPLRKSILDHIVAVNGIPAEKVTDIQAAIDQGDIDLANTLINGASRTRTATVKADGDDASIAAVDRQLNNVARTREVNFHAGSTKIFDAGGTVGADGGLGGEKRPEFAEIDGKRVLLTGPTMLPPGARVTSGAETARMLNQRWDVGGSAVRAGGSGGGGGVTLIVQGSINGDAHLRATIDAALGQLAGALKAGRR